jgi:hypothetical protein
LYFVKVCFVESGRPGAMPERLHEYAQGHADTNPGLEISVVRNRMKDSTRSKIYSKRRCELFGARRHRAQYLPITSIYSKRRCELFGARRHRAQHLPKIIFFDLFFAISHRFFYQTRF